jgi:23S rRNA-/tRNA-specific pseudouridylate synthase
MNFPRGALKKFTRTKISASKSPLKLVNGIYNPPAAMSKRTAKRWSMEVQKKHPEMKNINSDFNSKSLVVSDEDSGKSLESTVSKYLGIGKNLARLKIIQKEIWIENSMNARYIDLDPKGKVQSGDRLCILVKKARSPEQTLIDDNAYIEKLKNSVVYKDDRIIILNKWNIATHGGSKNKEYNIAEFARHLVSDGDEVPRLVHRLDKGTTGCLILARNAAAAGQLTSLIRQGSMLKRYIAVITPPLKDLKVGELKTITTGLVLERSEGSERERAVVVPWSRFFLI